MQLEAKASDKDSWTRQFVTPFSGQDDDTPVVYTWKDDKGVVIGTARSQSGTASWTAPATNAAGGRVVYKLTCTMDDPWQNAETGVSAPDLVPTSCKAAPRGATTRRS